jgi:RsiW-degrading membrane proteinase PrsW (M82 family)
MLTAVAVVPGILLMIYIYILDRSDREPGFLIVKLMFFGVVSALVASLIERAAIALLDSNGIADERKYLMLESYLCIGLVEEGMKFYYLKKKTWRTRDFDYTFDAIVYSVSVSLGFAIFENILYVYSYGLEVGITRAFTAIPGHFFDAILMGIFYGAAMRQYYKGSPAPVYKFSLLCALAIPVFIHGTYDFFAMSPDYPTWVFYVYLASLYITCFWLVNVFSKRDRPI